MNALFIGPYRQNDDWGLASRRYIRSIATQTSNLSIRPIYLASNVLQDLDEDLKIYENTQQSYYDIVFQHTLPHCFVPQTMTSKNIGIFEWSTNNISHSNAVHLLNRMSEICVPSTQEVKSLKLSGVRAPIKSISQPLDIEEIKQHLHSNAKFFNFDAVVERSFKFYTMTDYGDSKNLLDTVLAFNLAFDSTDNVSLIIYAQKPGLSGQDCHKKISDDILQLKQQMNVGARPTREVLITQTLSQDSLMSLHRIGDCYISATMGESFCRRSAEALCFGKTPIVTDNTGMNDYINASNGFLIKSHKTPVVVKERPLSKEFDIYNAYEYWYQPNIYSLIEHMQSVYTMYRKNKDALNQKRQLGMDMLETFSYHNIGNKICN